MNNDSDRWVIHTAAGKSVHFEPDTIIDFITSSSLQWIAVGDYAFSTNGAFVVGPYFGEPSTPVKSSDDVRKRGVRFLFDRLSESPAVTFI